MLLWPWDLLAENLHEWGDQEFIALTIGVNTAFFAIEKVKQRAMFAKTRAVRLFLVTQTQVQEADKAGIGSLLHKLISLLANNHRIVWSTCRGIGYTSGVIGAGLIYLNVQPCAYYCLLLYAPAFYLTSTIAGLLAMKAICSSLRSLSGVKPTEIPEAAISEQAKKIETMAKKAAVKKRKPKGGGAR